MVLYLINEHPSVSETFVVNEAAALKELGMPVLVYALKPGDAQHSAAPVDLLCPPPGRWQLSKGACKGIPRMFARLRGAMGARLSLGDTLRLLLAEAHAVMIEDECRAAGITHMHAHFIARTADVAGALAPRLGTKWTATAHAGDVYAASEPALLVKRLRAVDAVACANQGLEEEVRRLGVPAERTTIVHCGVDTQGLPFRERPVPD